MLSSAADALIWLCIQLVYINGTSKSYLSGHQSEQRQWM